jgi:hypothetical protein
MKTKGRILLLKKTLSSQRRKSSGNKPSKMDSTVFLTYKNDRAKSKKARNAKISHELRQILGGQAAAAMKKPKPPPKSRLLQVIHFECAAACRGSALTHECRML